MTEDKANKTVKDWIDDIRKQAMNDVDHHRASRLLNQLSALLGSVNEMWIQAEMNYNRKYEEFTKKHEKVTEARARAKASDEYEEKLRSESMVKVTEELIRAMKYVIKVKLQEAKEAAYEGRRQSQGR